MFVEAKKAYQKAINFWDTSSLSQNNSFLRAILSARKDEIAKIIRKNPPGFFSNHTKIL